MATEKSPKKAKSSKPKHISTHPKVSVMVMAAITTLKERKGSSLPAIKKYIAANYKADSAKLAPFIRRYLKSAVESKVLLQVKGKGASGSFKISEAAKKPKAAKAKKSPKKKAAPKKEAKKKSPAKKSKSSPKKTKTPKPKKAKSPKKSKKASPKKK